MLRRHQPRELPMRLLIFIATALAACAPPAEPRDAGTDRRIPRTDSASDVEEPFEDVFFPPVDATLEASAPDSESDATAPSDGAPPPDSSPDARPDARPDAGSDARDAAPDACPPNGFMDASWRACGAICCPASQGCAFDINGRPYCQS